MGGHCTERGGVRARRIIASPVTGLQLPAPMPDDDAKNMRLEYAPERAEAIHRALLAGLLGNVGAKGETHEYTGIRGRKFSIFPGSGLFKRRPAWVMSAEVVETSRTYARTVAPV